MTLFVALDRDAATLIRKSFKLKRDHGFSRCELYRGAAAQRAAVLAVPGERAPAVTLGYVLGRIEGERKPNEPLYSIAALTGSQGASSPEQSGNELFLCDKISDGTGQRENHPDIVLNPGIPLAALQLGDAGAGPGAGSGYETAHYPAVAERTLRSYLDAAHFYLAPHSYAVLGTPRADRLSQEGANLITRLIEEHAALMEEFREPLGEAERALLDRAVEALGLSRVQRDRLFYEARARSIRDRAFPRELVARYTTPTDKRCAKTHFAELIEQLRS